MCPTVFLVTNYLSIDILFLKSYSDPGAKKI